MPTAGMDGSGWRLTRLASIVSALLLMVASPAVAVAADPPRCRGLGATIVGTTGPDLLQGTPGADVIAGLGGRDDIFGGGGDDVICAGGNPAEFDADGFPVAEAIDGGDGNDRIHAGPGHDGVVTGQGNDRAYGGPGEDGLVGVNRDQDRGRGGFDRFFGGAGGRRAPGVDEPGGAARREGR